VRERAVVDRAGGRAGQLSVLEDHRLQHHPGQRGGVHDPEPNRRLLGGEHEGSQRDLSGGRRRHGQDRRLLFRRLELQRRERQRHDGTALAQLRRRVPAERARLLHRHVDRDLQALADLGQRGRQRVRHIAHGGLPLQVRAVIVPFPV